VKPRKGMLLGKPIPVGILAVSFLTSEPTLQLMLAPGSLVHNSVAIFILLAGEVIRTTVLLL